MICPLNTFKNTHYDIGSSRDGMVLTYHVYLNFGFIKDTLYLSLHPENNFPLYLAGTPEGELWRCEARDLCNLEML